MQKRATKKFPNIGDIVLITSSNIIGEVTEVKLTPEPRLTLDHCVDFSEYPGNVSERREKRVFDSAGFPGTVLDRTVVVTAKEVFFKLREMHLKKMDLAKARAAEAAANAVAKVAHG